MIKHFLFIQSSCVWELNLLMVLLQLILKFKINFMETALWSPLVRIQIECSCSPVCGDLSCHKSEENDESCDRDAGTSGQKVMSLLPLWIVLASTEEKQNKIPNQKRCSAVSGSIPKLMQTLPKHKHLLQGTLGKRALSIASKT